MAELPLVGMALPCIGFSISASSLMVVNKLIVETLPLPSLVCLLQLIFTAGVALVYASGDSFSWDVLRSFQLFVGLFTCTLYTSMKSLQYANLETVLCFRSCVPIVITLLECGVMGLPPPGGRANVCMALVLMATMLYALFGGVAGLAEGALAYGWVAIYIAFDISSVMLGKTLAHNRMSMWGRVLYTNALSAPPMLLTAITAGEHRVAWRLLIDSGSLGGSSGVTLLALSCVLGIGISFFGWRMRQLVRPSSFAMVSLANKFITVALNLLFSARHAPPRGIALLLVAMFGCTGYVLSTMPPADPAKVDAPTNEASGGSAAPGAPEQEQLKPDIDTDADEGSTRRCPMSRESATQVLGLLLLTLGPVALGYASSTHESVTPKPVGRAAPTAAVAERQPPFTLARCTASAHLRRILVTGGTGLLGTAESGEVHRQRAKYAGCEFHFAGSRHGDLTSYNSTSQLVGHVRPTAILHLAANVGGLFKNLRDPVKALEDNTLMAINVLRTAHAHGVGVVISVLSTCVFPEGVALPMTEADLHAGPAAAAHEGYAVAKRGLETLSRMYSKVHGHQYSCVIPTNIYGANDNFDLDDGHVLASLIRRCYDAKRDGAPFLVRGSGTARRQFIESRDLAHVMLRMLEQTAVRLENPYGATSLYDANSGPIIAAPDPSDEVSIRDLATMITRHVGCGPPIFNNNFSDGVLAKTVSNARLRSFWPKFEFTPLEVGIRHAADWFGQRYVCAAQEKVHQLRAGRESDLRCPQLLPVAKTKPG